MTKGKTKSVFFCKECGYESAKWMGQCPACHAWNSMTEEVIHAKSSGGGKKPFSESAAPTLLSEISLTEQDRIACGIGELDRVLGGGIVPGSLILVGGDPGIGKSTLLLQMCRSLAGKGHQILYISGEESLKQIKMRADRLGSFEQDMLLLCETNLTDIERVIRDRKPEVVIIDSIQTMYDEEVSSAPGSVSQVREATAVLLQLSKTLGIAVFIVGHVTKEGTVAGPRVLEHMVDTVLYFEGDRHASYRILRGVKNRFGSTNEIGVFEMREEGLIEVENPSMMMLEGRPLNVSGSCVACIMEGSRPIMAEVQALVSKSTFSAPRRTATGYDFYRMSIIIAVLEKRLGLYCSALDVYINIVGGLRLDDPAADLPVAMALYSSLTDKVISEKLTAFGEIGLGGEVRGGTNMRQRILEAQRLGFEKCIVPKQALSHTDTKGFTIKVIGVSNLRQAFNEI